jgi:hypothetical protein
MTRSMFTATMLVVTTFSASAQTRPNFSGVWKLDAAASRMVGAGGRVGPGPQTRQLRWIVDHRDPRITVTVDLRDSSMSREWSFTCTTDGKECVNELRDLNEVRRTVARWVGDTLQMTFQAESPHGNFQGTDRLWTTDAGQTLVFDRLVRDNRGERVIKQVYRKQERSRGQVAPVSLPSVELPAELDRVLRDYERFWRSGDAAALSELFTDDGFVARPAGWVRGRDMIREAYSSVGSDLRLRAVAYAMDDTVGYIVGAYRYGESAADNGKFVLALRRTPRTRWLIAADLDGTNRLPGIR